MSKLPEKLIVLKNTAETLKTRLLYTNTQGRVPIASDKANSKIVDILIKKFPEAGNADNEKGYFDFIGKVKDKSEELEQVFYTFLDCLEWRDVALSTLSEVAQGMTHLKWESNPFLMTAFLELVTHFVQIHVMISLLPERKIQLVLFYKIKSENLYNKVAQYISDYDAPFRKFVLDFAPSSNRIGPALVGLKDLWNKMTNVSLLRKQGTLSITLNPSQLGLPVQDSLIFGLGSQDKIFSWISFGLVLCPEEFVSADYPIVMKQVLGYNYNFPLYGDLVCHLHGEYIAFFEKYKSKNKNLKVNKEKKNINESLSHASSSTGIKEHKDRRIYIHQELVNLFHLCKDQPGLLGPKFPLVLATLSGAKGEILYYFRHTGQQPPKGTKTKEEDFKDAKISELIYYMDQTVALILQYRTVIQRYYLEYLTGPDVTKLEELTNSLSSTRNPGAAINTMTSIIKELQSTSANDFSHNFKGLRLNWLKTEIALSSPTCTVPIDSIPDVITKYLTAVRHTWFVDSIDELLDEHASLRELWYYKDHFANLFDTCLNDASSGYQLHIISLFRLLSTFPSNSLGLTSTDLDNVGRECVQIARKWFGSIHSKTVSLANEIAKSYIIFHNQMSPVNAAYPVLQKTPNFKFDKNFTIPSAPGTESEWKNRAETEQLRANERALFNLCFTLNEVPTFIIYDHSFSPREHIRDSLVFAFKSFSKKSLNSGEGGEIQRPSQIEKHLTLYATVIRLIENFIEIDTRKMISEILLGEVYHKNLHGGKLDWTTDADFGVDEGLIKPIAQWYIDFIVKRVNSKDNSVCYSVARKGFVSRTGASFQADLWVDLNEFKSLFNLVGPYGFKFIDREMLKYIKENVSNMKDILLANKNVLEDFAKNYRSESHTNEALKKIRDLDNFVTKTIAIGSALQFRELMREAASSVCSEAVPHIFNTISSSFSQYNRNTFSIPELVPLDCLASDVGLEVGTADQALKSWLSKVSVTDTLWDLLPFMFAAGYTAPSWGSAVYNPVLEAHNNNAHLLSLAVYQLITNLKATSSSTKDEGEIIARLVDFIEVSSFILLRLAKSSTKTLEKQGIHNLPSVLISLDQFLTRCPLVQRNLLEKFLPYALIRSEYSVLYEAKGKTADGPEL